MNIRPKIPMYLGGNTLDLDKWILENLKYYDWYSKLYPNALILQGNPLKQRNDNWNKNKLSSSHYTTDDLRRSAYNNYLYTKDYDARLRDLIYWSEQLKGLDKLSDLQIVDLYNTLALSIRDAREAPQTYNKTGYSGTNQTFRNMFYNRSMQGTNTPDYNIGYLENLDNIEGTSTWQRRMDRYENPFNKDTLEGLQNRTFYINVPGTNRQVKVYKKENGDIGLFPNNPSVQQQGTSETDSETGGKIPVGLKDDPESLWSKLGAGLKNIAPDLLDALRLAGNMYNNERVYNEMKKAIIPNLLQTYNTHRQVVGDEATKQAYYRRAALGETKAAQPFTSDADRQVAYMNEAKHIGDELRAQGDLADNLEIRRTSDESNQHQWANIARNTEVANSNLTELIKARAAKHQLTALKHSADWTNIDLFLLGKQAKLELSKAKQKAIQDLIDLLTMLDGIYEDPEYQTAYKNLQNVIKKHTNSSNEIDYDNPEVLKAQRELRKAQNNYKIRYWKTVKGKQGTKLTYSDNTDKYLYRTSRDIVEHFRKMSKMTDDSRIKTLPKPIKLTSHPKKRKYLYGGVAPFTIYRPLGVGGESSYAQSTTSSSDSGKSEKDTAAKDKLDMIKELFKQVQGLPVDVSRVYQEISNTLNKAKAFGEELTTDDIASMYLNSMQRLAQLKYSSDAYEKAKALVTTNGGINELAVGANGEMIFQNKEGEFKIGTILNLNDKEWNPLTNDLVLELRAKSPNLAFNDKIFNIVNNGVGMTKIAEEIKSLAAGLGSYDKKIEGISEVLSNKVKAGLLTIVGYSETPDGFYKITKEIKDSSSNVNAALNYIYSILPKNYKTLLEINSNGNGKQLILSYLNSQTSDYYKEDIAPLTGKASDKSKEEDLDKLGINSATQLLLGMSSPREFTFSIGNGNMFNGMARVSSITKDGNSVGADFAYSDIYKSDLHKNLDLDNASFGDVPINKALKDRIIIDNSTIAGVDLPYTTDRNGRIIPDFKMLNRIEEADLEILRAGINPETEPQKVNEIYAKHNLPIKYGADNRLTGNYKRFAVILATAIEDVFLDKSGLASNGTISLVSDEEEINKYINEIKKTTGEKEIDRDRPGLFTGDKDIYKGSIFIPIIGDLVDAVSATGGLKAGNYNELRSKYLTKNYNEAPLFVKQ